MGQTDTPRMADGKPNFEKVVPSQNKIECIILELIMHTPEQIVAKGFSTVMTDVSHSIWQWLGMKTGTGAPFVVDNVVQ